MGEEEDQYNGIIFDEFQLITEEMLLKFMKSTSQKFCALDPIPVWLLVECFDELKTVILFIVNSSLENGKFPTRCKVALGLLLRARVQTQITWLVSDLLVTYHSFQSSWRK